MKNKQIIKTFLIQIILSLFVFILSQILITLILNYLGFVYFDSSNWLRWDSGHYLNIANNGYEFFPCAGKYGYPENSNDLCGNTGWFPGYPILIKLINLIFKFDFVCIAGVLSKIFYFFSLLLVLIIAEVKRFSLKNIFFLSIPAFSFSFIYYNAIFPISSVLFFVLTALYFFTKDKIWMTAFFCMLASFFYPTGFLLSLVFAICILFRNTLSIKQKFNKVVILTIMGGLGLAFVFLIFQIAVNDWSAFIQVQSKYGHGLHNPVKSIMFSMKKAFFQEYAIQNFIYYQSFIVILGYIALSVYFFFYRLYKIELYLWSYIYITFFLLFPWTVGGNLSMYRAESLLLPFVFFTKDLRMIWTTTILILLLFLGIPLSYLFFTNILI